MSFFRRPLPMPDSGPTLDQLLSLWALVWADGPLQVCPEHVKDLRNRGYLVSQCPGDAGFILEPGSVA